MAIPAIRPEIVATNGPRAFPVPKPRNTNREEIKIKIAVRIALM